MNHLIVLNEDRFSSKTYEDNILFFDFTVHKVDFEIVHSRKKNPRLNRARLDGQGVSEIEPPLLGGATNGCLMSAERKFRCDASYFPCAPEPVITGPLS